VVTTGDAQHRWWSCCWGHVFEHDPVAEDDELRCPAFFDDEEPCGTSFVFEPFASRQEAVDALKPGSPDGRPDWVSRHRENGHRGPDSETPAERRLTRSGPPQVTEVEPDQI
jgi:hypothetical protein